MALFLQKKLVNTIVVTNPEKTRGLEGPLFDYYFAMNKNDKSQLTK